MAEYRTPIDRAELDEFIASVKNSKWPFFPTNRPMWLVERKGRVMVYGIVAKARVDHSRLKDGGLIRLRVSYLLPWLLAILLMVVLLLGLLFLENTTINGKVAPPFIERLGFIALWLLIWLVPISIFRALRRDFKLQIIKALKLTPSEMSS